MLLEKNTFGDMQQLAVTTTAVNLPSPNLSSGVKTPDRVIVQSLSTNTQPIFLKNSSDVAQDGSTGGYELPPASILEIPMNDYKLFYAIAFLGTQKLQIVFLGGL